MSTPRLFVWLWIALAAANGLAAATQVSLLTVHPYSFAATPPARVSVPTGERLQLRPLEMNTAGQWYKNEKPMANATDLLLTIPGATLDDAGTYYFQSQDGLTTQLLRLTVGPEQRLLNLSTRGRVGTGEQTLIVGFVVGGISEKKILLRAVGPSLAKFGVSGFVREPVIAIYDSKGQLYQNDYVYAAVVGIGKAEDIADATKKTGAFPLLAGSKDAVDVRPFAPGAYTMHITSKDGSDGVVVAEIYEVP